MTHPDYPWVPPLAGTEAEQLVGALDRMRTTFRWKADELDATQLQVRIGASALTIGSLLKHRRRGGPCRDRQVPRGPLGQAAPVGRGDIQFGDQLQRLGAVRDVGRRCRRSRATFPAAIAERGLDQKIATEWNGEHASLRRLLCDLLEEYGRHTGHADLIRKAIDGRVGEDPPPRWQPVGERLA